MFRFADWRILHKLLGPVDQAAKLADVRKALAACFPEIDKISRELLRQAEVMRGPVARLTAGIKAV